MLQPPDWTGSTCLAAAFLTKITWYAAMCSKLDSTVPDASGAQLEIVERLNSEVGDLCDEYIDLLENLKIRAAIAKAMEVSGAGNKFLQVRAFVRPRWKGLHSAS